MEEQIINLFAYEEQIGFNEIKRKLKVRSNKLAYWLKKLTKEKIIAQQNKKYVLTESAEHLIPYLSKNKSMLPVVLIKIGKQKQAFLYEREKRPYKGLLALPGGRILIGESPQDAAKRIMHTKHNIVITKLIITDMLIEHIAKKKKVLYSFLITVVTAYTKNTLPFTTLNTAQRNIVPSDYQILKRKGKQYTLDTINSRI